MKSLLSLHGLALCKPLALAAAVAAAFSAPAGAQSVADKNLPTVVVTATRTSQVSGEVLADHTVITSEEIARSGHVSLVDLLQRQRGIEITRSGGPGGNASVFLRGTAANQSIVLIDGVRVHSSTTGAPNWSAIPLAQIDRIEIVHGALSSLYGADAIGGVVQIFTKKGAGQPSATFRAGIGSHDTSLIEAGVSGAALEAGRLTYAFGASRERSDGFSATKPGAFGHNPDKDGFIREGMNGHVGLQLARGHELGLQLLAGRLESQYDGSPTADDRLEQDLASYSLYSRNTLLSNWTSLVRLGRSEDESNDSPSGRKFDTTQDHLSWQNDFAIGPSDLLQILLERREEQVDATLAALRRERTTNSAAAAYQVSRGRHLASASLRNDDSSQFGSRTTGALGYGYRISPAMRLNASYGTSFRAPSFNELYFPGFGFAGNQPEKGRNAEIGAYYDNGNTRVNAVYYRNRIEDLIVNAFPCPVDPATFPFGCAYNVNEARLTGLSLGASTRLNQVVLRGALVLQDPEDETTGRRLARRAKQHGNVGVEYASGPLSAGAELLFSSDRYDDAANRNQLPGYGVLNLNASYQFARNWTVFGRWNNVLDKDYELVRNFNTDGSNVFIGVRYGMR